MSDLLVIFCFPLLEYNLHGTEIIVLFTNISQMPRAAPGTQGCSINIYSMSDMNFYSFRKQRNGKGKTKITVNHLYFIASVHQIRSKRKTKSIF